MLYYLSLWLEDGIHCQVLLKRRMDEMKAWQLKYRAWQLKYQAWQLLYGHFVSGIRDRQQLLPQLTDFMPVLDELSDDDYV